MARLGLPAYAIAGVVTLFWLLAEVIPSSSAPLARPEPYVAALTSVLCGLTWRAHRSNRAWATRAGVALLLVSATVEALLGPSGGLADRLAAGCCGLVVGGVAVCVVQSAGRERANQAHDSQPHERRHPVITGVRLAGMTLFLLEIWASHANAIGTQHWEWTRLMLSVGVWGAYLSRRNMVGHDIARTRAAALVGMLLLAIPVSELVVRENATHSLLSRIIVTVALALTVALTGACWWLSSQMNNTNSGGAFPRTALTNGAGSEAN